MGCGVIGCIGFIIVCMVYSRRMRSSSNYTLLEAEYIDGEDSKFTVSRPDSTTVYYKEEVNEVRFINKHV